MMLVPIVEGHGEVEAVPVLLRRIASGCGVAATVAEPIRVKRTQITKDGELERYVELAARKCGPGDGILVLLDAEDDCPAELGQSLLQRARQTRSDRRIRVTLARSEFESWFLGGVRTLAGQHGLPAELGPPPDPEHIRDAKAWISRHMGAQHPAGYVPTRHQPAFAHRFDMSVARQLCPSFAKFCRDVEDLLGTGPGAD